MSEDCKVDSTDFIHQVLALAKYSALILGSSLTRGVLTNCTRFVDPSFLAKIADLQLQLETAETKVETQRMELLEHSKITLSSIQTPSANSQVSPSQESHLCDQCGHSLDNISNSHAVGSHCSNSPGMPHQTRQLEEALFGDDNEKFESADVQEAKEQITVLQETVQSLQSQLANERRNLKYTKSLLVDSEAMVERLSAQANILKSEIRRLERNAERERHLGASPVPLASPDVNSKSENLPSEGVTRSEYLKNVLLSFLCGSSGGGGGSLERLVLVPVLATLLSLAPDERAALQQVAQTGMLLYSRDSNSEISGVSSNTGLEGGGGASSWGGLIGLPSWLGGG
ncbi:hypothetical protein Aperf_G00000017460 [Anoplocephala perfoliata]